MADEIDERLEEIAEGVAEATIDGNHVKEQSLNDVVNYRKFKGEQAALTGTNANGGQLSAWGRCLRPARVILPGAIGPRNSDV